MNESNTINLKSSILIKSTHYFDIYYNDFDQNQFDFHDFFDFSFANGFSNNGLLTTLKMPLENTQNPCCTMHLSDNLMNSKIEMNFFSFKQGFIHARNLIQDNFQKDFKDGIIILDHGIDLPPYSGGKSLYFQNKEDQLQVNEQFLDHPVSFCFNAFSGDWDNDGYPEVFFCNLSDNAPHFYRNNNGIKLIPADDRLPISIRHHFFKVLSGTSFYDMNNRLHMAIGSSGLEQKTHSDLILENANNGKFNANNLHFLPNKRCGSDWATIQILNFKNKNSFKSDLLFNYHDSQVQNGAIDLFVQNENLQFNYSNSHQLIYQESDCWFPKIKQVSVTNQNSRDIIAIKSRGLVNYIQKELNLVWLSEENCKFIDLSEELITLGGKEFIGFCEKKKYHAKSDLFFIERNGNFFYLKRK